MFFFIGLAVVFGAVFGGYILAGGKMAPIIKAAPFEFIIIGGSAIGASLIANSFPVFKAAMGGIGKCIKGPSLHQADYLALMLLVGKLQTVMKKEGVVALESHVENPDSSAIFGEFPKLAISPLEVTESLEQLRAMWHGHRIAVHISPYSPGPGVDTPEDLARVQAHFQALA